MKSLFLGILVLVSISAKAQSSNVDLYRAIRVDGNVPGWYIKTNSVPVSKLMNIAALDSANNLGIGVTVNPKEKLVIGGAVKVGTPVSYTAVTNNSATPVPSGGVGTIIYNANHFYGWIGTAWKQLDN